MLILPFFEGFLSNILLLQIFLEDRANLLVHVRLFFGDSLRVFFYGEQVLSLGYLVADDFIFFLDRGTLTYFLSIKLNQFLLERLLSFLSDGLIYASLKDLQVQLSVLDVILVVLILLLLFGHLLKLEQLVEEFLGVRSAMS